MPYASDKQRAFFHTDAAKKAGITGAMVKEYDSASKGMNLPTTVKSNPLKSYAERNGK